LRHKNLTRHRNKSLAINPRVRNTVRMRDRRETLNVGGSIRDDDKVEEKDKKKLMSLRFAS
jgi:hypothetical protein